MDRPRDLKIGDSFRIPPKAFEKFSFLRYLIGRHPSQHKATLCYDDGSDCPQFLCAEGREWYLHFNFLEPWEAA